MIHSDAQPCISCVRAAKTLVSSPGSPPAPPPLALQGRSRGRAGRWSAGPMAIVQASRRRRGKGECASYWHAAPSAPPLILPADQRRLCLPGPYFRSCSSRPVQHRVEQRARDALVALALTVGAMSFLLVLAAPTTDACDSGIVQYTCRRCNER